MSTHALGTPDTPASVRVLRNLDLVVLPLALVLFLVAGFPMLGWVAAAGAWLAQRAINELAVRRSERSDDPRTKVGLLVGSMIARGWIVAGIILAIGVGDHHAGLAAALLFLAVFSLQVAMTLAMRPYEVGRR